MIIKYFSVPADFKKETIDAYVRLNSQYPDAKVHEAYGNITTGNFLQSGRSVNLLPPMDLAGLADYAAYSNEAGIRFNYTLNATHLHNREFTRQGILEIMDFLKKIHDAGIRSVTVAMPSLIDIVKSSGLGFEIKGSTLCMVVNGNKAEAFKNMGVDKIVADESLNRDFQALSVIRRRFGEKVELIANAICHKNCAYRVFHYNQMTEDSVTVANKNSIDYYSHRCLLQRYNDVSDLLRLSFIRPEDLHHYTAVGIQYFKLQGRQAVVKGDPVRAVEAYMKGSYDGDLMELLDMFDPTSQFRVHIDNKKLDGFIDPFVKNSGFCRNDCPQCKYCATMAARLIDNDSAEEVMGMARRFYDEYDGFNKELNSISGDSGQSETRQGEIDIDIDL